MVEKNNIAWTGKGDAVTAFWSVHADFKNRDTERYGVCFGGEEGGGGFNEIYNPVDLTNFIPFLLYL